ncbi:ABC transporter permease [Nitriliruptor alkaliphilus]|uniref:ABC transporter permease n=1 Tax=Nitriliruptor alkaliphilus TaxID=427918 RepID=UPI000696FB23|nr:ABC transporter permease [Nitriliruptor alkaliphilus]
MSDVGRTRLADRSLNPVLRRELLERWRGRRAVLVMTLYLGVLGGLLLLLRWIGGRVLAEQMQFGFGGPVLSPGPMLGRFLLENLLALVLGLVLLVAPGYAAAQLSGERERRTLGLLRITLVRPRSIVLGKLGASSAWIVLLVVVSAPLAATAFALGGATPGDLVRGLLVVLVTAVSVAAVALGVSSRARRTTGAVVTTYAFVLLLVVGTLIGAFAQFAASGFSMGSDRPAALYLNPFYALADATNATTGFGGQLPSVLTPFAAALPGDRFGDPFGEPVDRPMMVEEAGVVGMVEADLQPLPAGPERRSGDAVWPWTLLWYTLLAGLSLTLASRSLGPRDGVRET